MKPILITLLFIPPIVFLVALGHFWWQRVSRSPLAAHQVVRFLFWMVLAFGPLGGWMFATMNQPYYLLWVIVGIQWIIGVIRLAVWLSDHRRRLEARS